MKSKSLIEIWEANMRKVKEADKKAKEKGKLVGRYIDEPYADGAAIYKIIRENKNTVRIKVVVDIGDDWVIKIARKTTWACPVVSQSLLEQRSNNR